MTWIFGYLLIGFFFHFLGSAVWKYPTSIEWYWELAAVVLWPLAIVLVVIKRIGARCR